MGKRSTAAPVDMNWSIENDEPKAAPRHRAVVVGAWLDPEEAPAPRSARSHVSNAQPFGFELGAF